MLGKLDRLSAESCSSAIICDSPSAINQRPAAMAQWLCIIDN
jgi:hypothetical protein